MSNTRLVRRFETCILIVLFSTDLITGQLLLATVFIDHSKFAKSKVGDCEFCLYLYRRPRRYSNVESVPGNGKRIKK